MSFLSSTGREFRIKSSLSVMFTRLCSIRPATIDNRVKFGSPFCESKLNANKFSTSSKFLSGNNDFCLRISIIVDHNPIRGDV